ncbi:MAG: hypothetical protein Q8O61_07185 [Nocardioides sp.]|nr:hypothetical protein [Nocardioides sp.]
MRRPLALATLGLSLALSAAGFHAPAPARVIEPARAGMTCGVAVTGVSSDNRLREYIVKDGKVLSAKSSKKLGFRLTGLGYMSSETKDGVNTLRLTGTTTDGVPRQVTVIRKDTTKVLRVSAIPFAQRNFKPRLFTDAYGYYGYTINHVGVLQRWTLTRRRSGELFYRDPLTLKRNLKGTVALTTAAYRAKPAADILFTTTRNGALRVMSAPHDAPELSSFKTLSADGYRGVTELSSGYCTGGDRGVVVGIDPVAGTAAWTVVTKLRFPATAKAHPKGRIRGAANWKLHAVM